MQVGSLEVYVKVSGFTHQLCGEIAEPIPFAGIRGSSCVRPHTTINKKIGSRIETRKHLIS